ncbi:MAG: hypothetical protein ABJE95_19115 [Byssovorax sp.]
MKSLVFTLAAASMALLGCSTDEQLAPAPTAPVAIADAGPDAPEDADASMPVEVDAGTARRTVMTRNPFGGPAANQFADGDFELSTTQGTGQYGARAFATTGGGDVGFALETGGLCRSGLRCAVFAPKTAFLLRGAAAALAKGNMVSFWAKVPPTKPCTTVSGVMATCDTLVIGHGVKATTPQPDAAGWCSYSSRLPASASALCLYIQNKLLPSETALLDSAVMGPDDGTVLPQAAEFYVPSAELVEELAAVRETLRRTTVYGRPEARPDPPRR